MRTLFLFVFLCSGIGMAEELTERQKVVEKTFSIAQAEETFKAIEYLESQGEPLVVSECYSDLLRHSYFKEKNVALMVRFGQSGIDYALKEARTIEKNSPELAEKLKGIAKTISYNLGANTWPGWNDAGISITQSDLVAGNDAARLNLRLAVELKRNSEVLANAHWLIGAHLLAASQHDEAVKAFDESAALFRKEQKEDFALMAEGYVVISRLLSQEATVLDSPEFNTAVKSLNATGTEDAKFFVEQLQTAAVVFSK